MENPGEINVYDGLPAIHTEVLEIGHECTACVVHENIDPSELVNDFVHHLEHPAPISHITFERTYLPIRVITPHIRGCSVNSILGPGINRNINSFLG